MTDKQINKDLSWDAASVAAHVTSEGATQFKGYASLYNVVDDHGDVIMPGAFDKSLQDRRRPVLMYFGHSPGRVPGKWLSVKSDDRGLWVHGEFTRGNREAEDIAASVRHGALGGLSVGLTVPLSKIKSAKRGAQDVLEFYEAQLNEISIVSAPALDIARIDMTTIKSLERVDSVRELERFMRDELDMSAAAAKSLIAKARSLGHRDDDLSPTSRDDDVDLALALQSMRRRFRINTQ